MKIFKIGEKNVVASGCDQNNCFYALALIIGFDRRQHIERRSVVVVVATADTLNDDWEAPPTLFHDLELFWQPLIFRAKINFWFLFFSFFDHYFNNNNNYKTRFNNKQKKKKRKENLQNSRLCCSGWPQNKTERMWKEGYVPRPC